MGNWVLNIVGGVEDEAQDILASVVKAAKEAGHVIHSARLTTDEGETVLTVAKDADEVVDAVDPAAKPIADTVESDVDKLEADLVAKDAPEAIPGNTVPPTPASAPPATA